MTRVQVNDIKIDYKSYGDPAHETLLLIMGLGMIKEGWQRQVDEFAKHYHVITFDNRGVGQTDRPEEPYSTEVMAADAAGLLEVLGIDKAHILGTSMGGMIAQKVALIYPQKVRSLILAATYAKINDQIRGVFFKGMETMGLKNLTKMTEEDVARIDPLVVHNFLIPLSFSKSYIDTHPEEMAEIQKGLRASNPSFEGIINQVIATQFHNTYDKLPAITAPTLVLVGAEDQLIPPFCSEKIASQIPGAKLVKIPSGAHAFNWERPEAFNRAVLEFLQSLNRDTTTDRLKSLG